MQRQEWSQREDDGITTIIPQGLEPDLADSFIQLTAPPPTSTQPELINHSHRLFYRQEKLPPPLGQEADILVSRMKNVLLEIHLIKDVILPTLDDSPCNIRHVISAIPKKLTLAENDIIELQKLCVNNIRILNGLKYARDGLFTTGKASSGLGLVTLLILPSIGLELILFGICVAAVILYLDKYAINNGQKRDHFFPTREDIFDSTRYKQLLGKYTTLKDYCDQWLDLDHALREEYEIKDSALPSEELMEMNLRLEYTRLGKK